MEEPAGPFRNQTTPHTRHFMSATQQWPRRLAADEQTALRSVPILADIDDEQLDQLARSVDRHHIPAGEWLVRMGDLSDAIYIVDSGRFAAVGTDGHVIRELASGDSIGELGVIAGAVRSAGVRALRDSVVWRIAAVPIADAIATHLGSHGQIAVVAPPVDTTAAVHSYGGRWAHRRVQRNPRSGRAKQRLGVGGGRPRLRRPLATICCRAKRSTRGPGGSITSTRSGQPTCEPGASTPGHVHGRSRSELVGSVAAGLASPADDDGIGALARRIAGRSLGLVLAGGGVRGLAHFGVYEELTRAGIVIDRFGGTNVGAIAAAAFALGMDAQEAITAVREFFAQGNPLGDYAIPAVALTRGGRFDRLIEKFVGTTLIEHLPKGFFSVSADMITGNQIVDRRGRLSVAVRASLSIPGLMPPVQHGEQILVDGGLLNNLPADVMCADPDGEVICVDLRRKYVPSKGFGVLPSILQPPGLVRRLVTGTDVALPALQETLLRAFDLAASSGNLRELPRVAGIVEPDVSAIGPLDFKKVDAALDAGRIAACAALQAQPHLVG